MKNIQICDLVKFLFVISFFHKHFTYHTKSLDIEETFLRILDELVKEDDVNVINLMTQEELISCLKSIALALKVLLLKIRINWLKRKV